MPHPEQAMRHFAGRFIAALLATVLPACAQAQAATAGKPSLSVKYETAEGCRAPNLLIFGGTSPDRLTSSTLKSPRIAPPDYANGRTIVEIEYEIADPAPFLTPPIRIAFLQSNCPVQNTPEVTLNNVNIGGKLATCVASPIFWAGAVDCKAFGAQSRTSPETTLEERPAPTTETEPDRLEREKKEAEETARKQQEEKRRPAQETAGQEAETAERARVVPSLYAQLLAMPAEFLLLMLCAAVYLFLAVILGLADMVRARHTRRFIEDQQDFMAALADQINGIRDDLAQLPPPASPPAGNPPAPPPVPVLPPQAEAATMIVSPIALSIPDDRAIVLSLPSLDPLAEFTRAYRSQILTRARAEALVQHYGIAGYDRHPENPVWLVHSPKDVMGDLNFWALPMDDGTCLVCPSYHINVDLFSLQTADGLGARRLFGEFFDIDAGNGELSLERPAIMRRVNDRILEIVQRGRISL